MRLKQLTWVLGIAVWAGVCLGQTAPECLRSGWEEYSYQAYPQAAKRFRQALAAPEAGIEDRYQAKLGLAFVTHYQMPGRDPAAASGQYLALLEELPADHRLRPLVLARLGDCHAEIAGKQLPVARDFCRQAIAAAGVRSIVGQEAVLRLVTTYMRTPDPAVFAEGLAVCAEFAPQLRGAELAGPLHGLGAELAFFRRDWERYVAELTAQYEAGIRNVQIKEKVLFSLARTCEVKRRDYRAAEHWYRVFAAELPTSTKRYFATLRADELARGQIVSDYAPPPEPVAGETPNG